MPDIEKEIQEQNGQTANKPDAEETVKGEKEVVSKEEGATAQARMRPDRRQHQKRTGKRFQKQIRKKHLKKPEKKPKEQRLKEKSFSVRKRKRRIKPRRELRSWKIRLNVS